MAFVYFVRHGQPPFHKGYYRKGKEKDLQQKHHNMLNQHIDDALILRVTRLSLEELTILKNEASH